MKIVISLSGSFISDNLENEKLKEYVEVFEKIWEEMETLVIVSGAGSRKDYINATKNFDISEGKRDMIGIRATRLHAYLLNSLLGKKSHPKIPESIEEVEEFSENDKIIAMGGTEPGHSTDAVAALAGEIINADLLINATQIDGVYEEDPKENSEAEKIKNLSYKELFDLISEQKTHAGGYSLIDFTAAKIIERASLKTVVIDGNDPEEILKASKGNDSGSVIS